VPLEGGAVITWLVTGCEEFRWGSRWLRLCEYRRMEGNPDNPAQQFSAAWQAATDALGEWRQRVSEATTEALGKLEPAVRAAVEAGRAAVTGDWNACHCPCRTAHPDDKGVCDGRAVMSRRVDGADVALCAPCAVAQGVAEMPR
jgi:hypothetical protein